MKVQQRVETRDPADDISMTIGMDLYDRHGLALKPQHIHKALMAHVDAYLAVQELYESYPLQFSGNGF